MRGAAYSVWLAASVGLLGWSAAELGRAAQDARGPLGPLLNSDMLHPAAVYQDQVLDGYRLDTYRFPAANYAFPDTAAYFPVRAAVGQTGPAVLVWAAGLFALLAVTGGAAAAAVCPRPARRYAVPAALSLVALYLGFAAHAYLRDPPAKFLWPADLLLPVSHNGATICAFAGLCVTLGLLRSRSRAGAAAWLAGLAVVCALAIFSDRLFAVAFAAPWVASLAAAKLLIRPGGVLKGLTWRRLIAAVAAVAAGTAGGVLLLRAAQPPDTDPLQGYFDGLVWDGLADRARALAHTVWQEAGRGNVLVELAAVWYVLCAASAVAGVWRRLRKDRRPADGLAALRLYQLYSVLALAAVAAAFLLSKMSVPLLGRGYPFMAFSRYFAGPLAVAFFGLAARVAVAAAHGPAASRVLAAAAPAGLAVWFLAAAGADPASADIDLADPAPPYVRRVDEVCRRYGLKDGLGGYWPAKQLTLLSRAGVRVRAVRPDRNSPFGLQAQHWVSNAEWYWRSPAGGPAPRYQFVVADNAPGPDALPVADVVAALGEPAVREPAGRYTVLVYDRPSDRCLSRFHELEPTVLNLRLRADPGAVVRYPGNALYEPGGRPRAADGPRVAVEGVRPSGVLAFGPYFEPGSPGVYRVACRVTSAGSPAANGEVKVLWNSFAGGGELVLGRAEVRPGTAGEVALEVQVGRDLMPGVLSVLVEYRGRGTLVLHDVALGRAR